VSKWTAKNGQCLTIRPIRPEDEPLLVNFHGTLSDRSVYMRYLHPLLLSERVAHERLARICHCDYNREIILVAEQQDAQSGEGLLLGVGRLSKLHGLNDAQFSLLVSDCCQGLGIGSELLRRLIQVGRDEKLRRIEANITADNHVMQRLCERLGFRLLPGSDNQMVKAEMDIS
jgi:acetyltransferase